MAFRGCLVKKSTNQTTANYSSATVVNWDAEVYDTDAFHSTSTNTSRITIPSAVNGQYGIFSATISMDLVSTGAIVVTQLIKNAGSPAFGFIGFCSQHNSTNGNGQSTAAGWNCLTSPPILLTTSDFYDLYLQNTDTSITVVAAGSSFGLHVLDYEAVASYKLTLAKLSGDASVNFNTPSAIAWDGADVYDTDDAHSPSSNNTQIIIPASMNGKYVVASANVVTSFSSGSAGYGIAIRKNGSLTYDGLGADSGTSGATDCYAQAYTAPVQVSTGDTFDVLYSFSRNVTTTVSAAKSSFGLRVVGS